MPDAQYYTQPARRTAANDARMVQGIKRLMVEDVGAGWKQMHSNELQAHAGSLAPTPNTEGFKDFLGRQGRQ